MVGKWLGNASCNNLESKTQRLPKNIGPINHAIILH